MKPLTWTVDEETGCWIGDGGRREDGRKKVLVDGRTLYAYRWMYEQEHGPIPPGCVIHHRCRDPRCLNVEHMIVTTQPDHLSQHMSGIPKSAEANAKLGETQQRKKQESGQARVTPRGVQVIRSMSEAGKTRREIADYFGVSRKLIDEVVRGRSYRWVS
jgi:hypothetical protein